MKEAKPGDTIYMAAGNYSGALGASEIIIDKPLTIKGGYSDDFATRDLAKFTTTSQPPNDNNDSKGIGVITLKLPNGAGPDMVLDGIVIDQCELLHVAKITGAKEDRYVGAQTPVTKDFLTPTIVRDTSKCVLCGRCVARCKNAHGIGILGFENRGFKTIVAPAENRSFITVRSSAPAVSRSRRESSSRSCR